MTGSKMIPVTMGAAMGLMGLMLVHRHMTADDATGFGALLAFAGAHVVVVLAVLAVPLFVARRAPWLAHRLRRLHRPGWDHIGWMIAGAATAAFVVHLWIHGGIV